MFFGRLGLYLSLTLLSSTEGMCTNFISIVKPLTIEAVYYNSSSKSYTTAAPTSIPRWLKEFLANNTYSRPPESCWKAWESYNLDIDHWIEASETLTAPIPKIINTKLFETIQSFGPNQTYTEDDGIPRLRFAPSPTSSRTITVEVVETFYYGKEANPSPTPGPFPAPPTSICPYPGSWWGQENTPAVLASFPSTPCNQDLLKSFSVEETPEPPPCLLDEYCSFGFEEEVVLIFWPNRDLNQVASNGSIQDGETLRPRSTKPREFTTNAITFRGQDLLFVGDKHGNVTITPRGKISHIKPYTLSGSFTFTSPTVYLAHQPFYITRSATLHYPVEGPDWDYRSLKWPPDSYSAGIIALSSSHVYTLRKDHSNPTRATNKTMYAQLVARGKFVPGSSTENAYQTLPLRFEDLENPVPASNYYDARWEDCWGEQTHCGTITDDSFRPRLSIHSDVWTRFYSQISCDMPNLVDPPIALQEVDHNLGPKAPVLPVFGANENPVVTSKVHVSPYTDSPAIPGQAFRLPSPTGMPQLGSEGKEHQELGQPNPLRGPLGLSYGSPGTNRKGGGWWEHRLSSHNSRPYSEEDGDYAYRDDNAGVVGEKSRNKNSNVREMGSRPDRSESNGSNGRSGARVEGPEDTRYHEDGSTDNSGAGNGRLKVHGSGGDSIKGPVLRVRCRIWGSFTTFYALWAFIS